MYNAGIPVVCGSGSWGTVVGWGGNKGTILALKFPFPLDRGTLSPHEKGGGQSS